MKKLVVEHALVNIEINDDELQKSYDIIQEGLPYSCPIGYLGAFPSVPINIEINAYPHQNVCYRFQGILVSTDPIVRYSQADSCSNMLYARELNLFEVLMWYRRYELRRESVSVISDYLEEKGYLEAADEVRDKFKEFK